LSADEVNALLYMREEEKLAHDVYVYLYSKWGLSTFQNIASSEQVHTQAIKNLIDRYGLQDPASSQAGVFANAQLQTLYEALIAQGSQSLVEALKVGAAIEEIDILDLQGRLTLTQHADIQQVFNNLLWGSGNHLRAFVSRYEALSGTTYQPQTLSPEAYQQIMGAGSNGAASRSRGYRGGR
jgi:hypothetical protein